MQKLCKKYAPKAILRPFFNLVNNPKQQLRAKNSLKNKIFTVRVMKKSLKS